MQLFFNSSYPGISFQTVLSSFSFFASIQYLTMGEEVQFLKFSHDHNVKLAYSRDRNTFFLTSEDLLSCARYGTPLEYNSKLEQKSLSDSASNYDTLLFQNERMSYISEHEVSLSYIDDLVEDIEEEFENFLLSKSSRSGYSTPDPKPLFSLSDDFNTAFQNILKEIAYVFFIVSFKT
jgi:hypothetical protein